MSLSLGVMTMTQQLKHSLRRQEAKRKAMRKHVHSATHEIEEIKDTETKAAAPVSLQELGEPTHTLGPVRKRGLRINFNDF
jgi:ribosomal protein L17